MVLSVLLVNCASSIRSEYTLIKKYPQDIPDLSVKILSDTTGLIIQQNNQSLKQDFKFIKKKKNFLIITSINDNDKKIVSMKKGDTIVYHKNELYLFNKEHKLVFKKKESVAPVSEAPMNH
jgi:hypothetical protein